MSTTLTLCDLKLGDSAFVTEVTAGESAMERRLRDLGLIPGTEVTCMAKSPSGDPCAYLIRGAVIALRRKDAQGVRLERAERPVTLQEALAF